MEINTGSKLTREDILKAQDAKKVLSTYIEASKSGEDRERLQKAVAERFLQLGDEDKATQFLVLAEQTRNVGVLGRIVGAMENEQGRLRVSMNMFHEGVEQMGKVSQRIEAAAGDMSRAANKMSR